jgi:putative transposase
MPQRRVPLVQGSFYHVYNRGVNRGLIFFRDENWPFFVRRMKDFFKPDLVEAAAYCLMPTHYHLLLLVKSENFSSEVMHPFITSYTKAINRQNGRVGPLFQGRFQAKRIEKDSHLLHLSRYIHLNPGRAGLAKSAADWQYSSYQDYIGMRTGNFIKPGIIMEHFSSVLSYRDFVESDVENGDEEILHLI